jgi:hypothetical protein
MSGRENLSAQLAPTWILDVVIIHPNVNFQARAGKCTELLGCQIPNLASDKIFRIWKINSPMPYTYPKIKPKETKNYLTMLIVRAFTSG